MKSFFLIEQGLPVQPILDEIRRWPDAWGLQTGRQKIAVQREARSIPIRGLRKSKIRGRQRRDVHETRFTTISRQFPRTTSFICERAERFDAALSRAKLVCLPPGHVVYPHVDRGEYYSRRNRFHLVLQSEGSWMRAGSDEVRMRPGELWWFDNKAEHEARNDGDRDRIHLIFDLEPRSQVLGANNGFGLSLNAEFSGVSSIEIEEAERSPVRPIPVTDDEFWNQRVKEVESMRDQTNRKAEQ